METDLLLGQRDHERVKGLSQRLIDGINSQVEHVIRNGDVHGYPGCVNLSFAYVEGESLLMALKVSFGHLISSSPHSPPSIRILRCHQGVLALLPR